MIFYKCKCCQLNVAYSIQPIEFALDKSALNECIFTFNVICGSILSNMKAYLETVNFLFVCFNSWAKVTKKTNILNLIQI